MKNYYSLLICLMCFAGGAAIAQPNSDTAVFGVVVEKSTGEPMEFVDVVLYEHESETFLDGITTNKKGEFRFSDIAPCKYYVQTNFMGYEPMKSRVFAIDGKNQAVDLMG